MHFPEWESPLLKVPPTYRLLFVGTPLVRRLFRETCYPDGKVTESLYVTVAVPRMQQVDFGLDTLTVRTSTEYT